MLPVRTRSQDALDKAAEEAAILQTAQDQARAEEEIGHRLPREGLNISRRLEQQQQSVDDLNGTISNLTDMVTQLGLTIQRSGTAQSSTAQVQENQRYEFATPASSHHQLSPIVEGATPNSTPIIPPVNPHPSQLPQPRFNLSPIQFSNVPNSQPFSSPHTTNCPTSQPKTQFHSETNPLTHRHMYQPSTSHSPYAPFSHPPSYYPDRKSVV